MQNIENIVYSKIYINLELLKIIRPSSLRTVFIYKYKINLRGLIASSLILNAFEKILVQTIFFSRFPSLIKDANDIYKGI